MIPRGEDGVLSGFVAVVAAALVMVAGMVYDGGHLVAAQAEARELAAAAARAGAQEVDLDAARSGQGPLLDPERATAAAEGFLTASGHDGQVRIDGDTVAVTVTLHEAMRVLPLAARTVSATEVASALDQVRGSRP
ncbi:MAG TPA: hypothetical protein VFJ85_15315 [Acidimicrobiales bacterium]|nr:hypothetical protein [Acidimicrobiales bacterium]